MNNNQRDARWANIPVGFGDQVIGQVGCTISVIGDILGLTPPQVNEALKRVNGFSDGVTLGKGNLVVWAKVAEAFPGTEVRRVWSYDNNDILLNAPNVIVEVPATPIGGRGSHWVRYIGNHQLDDPWTGITRPTSDFPNPTGYCVILPKTIPNPAPTPTPILVIDDKTKYDFGGDIGIQELGAMRSRVNDLTQRLANENQTIISLQSQLKDAQASSLQSASLLDKIKALFS